LQIKGVNEKTVWAATQKNEKLLLVQEHDPYCSLMTMKKVSFCCKTAFITALQQAHGT